jgi:hypothetical protein
LELRRDVGGAVAPHVPPATARTRELEQERLERLHVAGADVGHRLSPDAHPAVTA